MLCSAGPTRSLPPCSLIFSRICLSHPFALILHLLSSFRSLLPTTSASLLLLFAATSCCDSGQHASRLPSGHTATKNCTHFCCCCHCKVVLTQLNFEHAMRRGNRMAPGVAVVAVARWWPPGRSCSDQDVALRAAVTSTVSGSSGVLQPVTCSAGSCIRRCYRCAAVLQPAATVVDDFNRKWEMLQPA